MRVESYSFGRITVGGKAYTADLIIYPDRVEQPWWRKEGHSLAIDDLTGVIGARPDVLFVGTGAYGVMKVPAETVRFLRENGIAVEAATTPEAVEMFNSAPKGRKVVAALHLTC